MADGDIAASYGFTVVQSTADIRLGYNDINRGADFAAGLAGPVNGALTLGSGSTDTGSRLRKVKNRVVFTFSITNSATATAGTVLATLPAGFRPSSRIIVPAYFGLSSGQTLGYLNIDTDGTVNVRATAAGATGTNGFVTFDVG